MRCRSRGAMISRRISGGARTREGLVTLAVFCVAAAAFYLSPVRHVGDNQYAVLLSESLLDHHSCALERYFPGAPWVDSSKPWYHAPWQLYRAAGHVYYYYPPGASVLSLPLVALVRSLGLTAVRGGVYDAGREMRAQAVIAALLMAALAAVLYLSARLLLPPAWSAALALGTAFGSSVWSTASRGLWSQTWEILLLACLLYLLLAHEAHGHRLRAGGLGALAALVYVVRPTGSIPILLIGAYLAWARPRQVPAYAAGVVIVLAGFVLWSSHCSGELLPPYYRSGRELSLGNVPAGLAGTLLSPSRGLLVYSPAVWWVGALLVVRRRFLRCGRLAVLCVAACGAYEVLLAAWPSWWGGQSYGARLSISMLPWLAALGVLASRAELDARAAGVPRRRLAEASGLALLALGALMNAPAAMTAKVQYWNHVPWDIDVWPIQRAWDWRRPQPLAAFGWPLSRDYRTLPDPPRIRLADPAALPYLWGGWSAPDGTRRWTAWTTAGFIFRWNAGQAAHVRVRAESFLGDPAAPPEQTVHIRINGQRIGQWTVRGPTPELYEAVVPGRSLGERNELSFEIPGAVPVWLDVPRPHVERRGMGVEWIELSRPAAAP